MLVDNNKFPELKRKIKEMSRLEVRVGILGNAELAVIARANEYGAFIKPKKGKFLAIPITKAAKGKSPLSFPKNEVKKNFIFKKSVTIPERSFFRSAFDLRKNINKVVNIAEQVFSQDSNVKNILDKIGLYMTGAIQAKIKSNIQPSNSSLTVFMKGGKNRTLIDSGALGQGISHKIV